MSIKPAIGQAIAYLTLDVSDGGLFLLSSLNDQIPVGTEVIITPARYVPGVAPPTIRGRVIRSSEKGMGIEFIDEGTN